jgi:hypothetical protein
MNYKYTLNFTYVCIFIPFLTYIINNELNVRPTVFITRLTIKIIYVHKLNESHLNIKGFSE